jgi:DnaJ-class molecular chaperone
LLLKSGEWAGVDPDKNQDNAEHAAQMFMDVQRAHDILTDESKRRNYDLFGDADGWLKVAPM